MRAREVCWSICLAGLPFAHLVFIPILKLPLDIWQCQAQWMQWWVGILTALAVSEGCAALPNAPLAAWMAWTVSWVCWAWTNMMLANHQYPIPLLMPFLHLVVIWLFYLCATSQWTEEFLPRLLRWVARSGVVVVVYCALQVLNLDQFFTQLPSENTTKDALVGTIGNPSHLVAHVALLIPCFLLQSGKRWWGATGGAVGIILLSNKASGYILLILLACWYGWWQRGVWRWVIGSLGIVGFLLMLGCPFFHEPHGRLQVWGKFYGLFSQHPITGQGPGFVYAYASTITEGFFKGWRHCHNEWLQLAVEQGVVGLAILLWAWVAWWQRFWKAEKTPLVLALGAIFLSFGFNSLINFPAHLWLLGSFGFLAYCGLWVVTTERQDGLKNAF